jgi:hypothetical protein
MRERCNLSQLKLGAMSRGTSTQTRHSLRGGMEEAGKSARFPITRVFPVTKDILKRS